MSSLNTCTHCNGFNLPSAHTCIHCDQELSPQSKWKKTVKNTMAVAGSLVMSMTLSACYGQMYPDTDCSLDDQEYCYGEFNVAEQCDTEESDADFDGVCTSVDCDDEDRYVGASSTDKTCEEILEEVPYGE